MKKIMIISSLCSILFLDGGFMETSYLPTTLTVSSSSFPANGPIPSKYSYLKGNVSPQISWSTAPIGTKSFVIICEDPDAPRPEPWVHWIVYNIPTTSQSLTEGASKYTKFPQGTTDYAKIGWGGPNPPSGTHRYHFYVYALDADLPGLKNPTKAQLLQAMNKHTILAKGMLIGTYSAS